MKFGKLLAGVVEVMPSDYRKQFLQFKLLKKHIFLHQISACQCHIRRQLRGSNEVFRHPASQGRPCHLCTRHIYSVERADQFHFTVYDDGDDDSAAVLDLEYQCYAFEKLLNFDLKKINGFFVTSMQYYIHRLNDLDLLRSEEESRQDMLHPGGRRFWTMKKLLNLRRRMITLSQKISLLHSYSVLNHAAFEKILKKHDRITGSNIRREFVHVTVEHKEFFLRMPELKEVSQRCIALIDRFPRPRRTRATHRRRLYRAVPAVHHRAAAGAARAFPIDVPLRAAFRREDVWNPYDSSSTSSESSSTNPLRRRLRARRPPAVGAPPCVYTRAAQVAADAILQLQNGESSTHNCESLYPPNL